MMFEEIIAQEIPKEILQKALQKKRLPSAFLFYGPDGIGKKTLSLLFAKALNCKETQKIVDNPKKIDNEASRVHQSPPESSSGSNHQSQISHPQSGYPKSQIPCGVCSSCMKIDSRNHPDVRIIEPESKGKREISIEVIRELRREVGMKPFEGKKRIYLLFYVDRMSLEASNAFLKTLEEPPLDTLFILTSTRPNFLLPTILSRCQKIRFNRLNRKEVARALEDRFNASPEKAELLSRLSQGELGLAIELLRDEFFLSRGRFSDFFFDLPNKSHLEVLDFVEEQDALESVTFLFSLYRDLLLLKTSSSEGQNGDGIGLIENPDILSHLKDLEETLSLEEILSRIEELERGWVALQGSVNPRLILSLFLFKHLQRND